MAYIIDDIINALGAQNASAAQQANIKDAMALMERMYGDQQSYQQPYMQAGQATLADLLGQMRSGAFNTSVDPSQIANDPGFQFRMQQGQQALERSAAARGGLMSGGFAKGLTNYSQGLASTEFNNAFQRNQSENQLRFGRMMGIAGMGQGAANMMSGMAGQYGGNMGNLYGAMGNAQAAGAIGQAKGMAGAFNSLGNMVAMYYGGPSAVSAMNSGGGGGGGGFGGGGGGGSSTGFMSSGMPSANFGLNGMNIPTQGGY